MMTVNKVSKITGVSVRTIHYYDEIGLLTPSITTKAGYRMYDRSCLERLHQILLFRELEFSLKDIMKIIDSPTFDRNTALTEQIRLLTLKKEHLEDLISLAQQIKSTGDYIMDFKAFDHQKIEKYKKEAKEIWGNTDAYHEYEEKTSAYSAEKQNDLAAEMMGIFAEFGDNIKKSPDDPEVRNLVIKLQNFITDNYYTCSKKILSGLGVMYTAGGEMTDNIDAAGGKGTSEFVAKAIAAYCK